jgi:putative ATP-binding cassette transporter
VLSGHEQQRLSMARALLYEPEWLFLDKATSELDEAMEKRVYGLLAERLPRTAVISVVHRPAVESYHTKRWTLARRGYGPAVLQPA